MDINQMRITNKYSFQELRVLDSPQQRAHTY